MGRSESSPIILFVAHFESIPILSFNFRVCILEVVVELLLRMVQSLIRWPKESRMNQPQASSFSYVNFNSDCDAMFPTFTSVRYARYLEYKMQLDGDICLHND